MSLLEFPDGVARCSWCASDDFYVDYHDDEWGRPVADDRRLFEKICLEGFQSGLSWRTILVKRDNFRAAFEGFDFEKVAEFGAPDVERLLGDAGIIRHRGKIEATINNAARAREMVEKEGSLAAFVWRYEAAPAPYEVRATSPESVAMAKELKKRGWKFFGPTTAYAFMQSMGLVNDHHPDCAHRAECEAERAAFQRPV